MKKTVLSPHLSIYKPQISSALSILHRISGVFIYIGLLILAWFLILFLNNANILMGSWCSDTDCIIKILNGKIIRSLITLWSLAVYYHFFNGIRFLFLGMGKGFDKKHFHLSGYVNYISYYNNRNNH